MNFSSSYIAKQTISTIYDLVEFIKSESEDLEDTLLSTKEKLTIKAASNRINNIVIDISFELQNEDENPKVIDIEIKSFEKLKLKLSEIQNNCKILIGLLTDIKLSIHPQEEDQNTRALDKDQQILGASLTLSSEIEQITSLINDELERINPAENSKKQQTEKKNSLIDIAERLSRIEQTISIEKINNAKDNLLENLINSPAEIDVEKKKAIKSIGNMTSDFSNTITTEREKLSNNIQEFENLLSVLTGTVISEKYDQYAAEEKTTADNLRYATIGCLTASVIATIGIFIESFFVSTGIEAIALRFAIIFSIALPAAYLAKESEKHRRMQHKFRRMDLDLKAIKPYLSSLPDDMQHQIRGEIAHKIFGQSDNEIDRRAFPVDIHELIVELIKNTKTSLTPDRKSSS